MYSFLDYTFTDSPEFVTTFDELPLWSAPFGLLLLKHIELKLYDQIIDLGSGSGFPIIELAARLGPTTSCFGIDPWTNANSRANQKIKNYGLSNVKIIEASAEQIPFNPDCIDLIVSNLGLNNFENPGIVLAECFRVLKPGSGMAVTTNLNGHWSAFYDIFRDTITQMGNTEWLPGLQTHIDHRGTLTSITTLFEAAGFKVAKHVEESFTMKFLNGSAFLNHYFIKLGWLSAWKELIPVAEHDIFFRNLESNLNGYAQKTGCLELTVPMAYFEAEKPGL